MRLQDYWRDKVIFITGGSSGIGLAAAKLLAGAGAHVWLAARRQDRLEAARQHVDETRQATARPCGIIAVDVSDPLQVADAVKRVEQEAGRLDVIFNSAGITMPGYVQDLSLDEFQKQTAVNYLGTVYVTKAALPAMIARRAGHIINISSMAGLLGVFGYSAYGATKYAVTGFSEVLRAEMKPHGIRVSVAFPPDTDTPQLAFETPYKPAETKAISGTARALSARKVATAVLEQAARGRFMLFPGFDSWFFYILSTKLPKGLVFAVLDQMAASGRKKKAERS
jgi:3-dehydrosphinganine reductase